MNAAKNICIIPARGGSKRIINKNSVVFGGMPLLEHSIAYAQANPDIIGTVLVSTDDSNLAKIAEKAGAQVLMRPAALAADTSPTIDVLMHALETLKESYEHVILLQPTNPLRPKSLLKKAFVYYLDQKADSLMTVTRNHEKLGKIVDHKFVPFNYTMGQRSQDLEPLYSENGLLYISKAALIQQGKILGEANVPFQVDHPYASVDIDTIEDLHYANYILETTPK